MIVQPHFHIGLAVPDVEAAMATFGSLGVQWRTALAHPLCVFHEGASSTVDIRSVYSAGAGPAVELFSGGAGTPLAAATAGSQFHHVGFWADDFAADVAALQAGGFPLLATVAGDGGAPSRFALHGTPFGFHVELVDPRWAGRLLADLLPAHLRP